MLECSPCSTESCSAKSSTSETSISAGIVLVWVHTSRIRELAGHMRVESVRDVESVRPSGVVHISFHWCFVVVMVGVGSQMAMRSARAVTVLVLSSLMAKRTRSCSSGTNERSITPKVGVTRTGRLLS